MMMPPARLRLAPAIACFLWRRSNTLKRLGPSQMSGRGSAGIQGSAETPVTKKTRRIPARCVCAQAVRDGNAFEPNHLECPRATWLAGSSLFFDGNSSTSGAGLGYDKRARPLPPTGKNRNGTIRKLAPTVQGSRDSQTASPRRWWADLMNPRQQTVRGLSKP